MMPILIVVTGGTGGCRYDNLRAASYDKVGIMTTIGFSGNDFP